MPVTSPADADVRAAPAGITRRDFLDGSARALGALASGGMARGAVADESGTVGGVPIDVSFGGQDDVAMAMAHAWRDASRAHADAVAERDEGVEDLVVVGAGLSGLAGAWLFRQHAGRPVRMLLLDAQARPGGHAQREEFTSRSGRRVVAYGGSQSLDSPSLFSPAMNALLAGLQIDLARFPAQYYDAGWAERHGVAGSALWFERGAGAGTLVRRTAGRTPAQWLPDTPLPPPAQADWLRLLEGGGPRWAHLGVAARRYRLAAMTYREFLLRHARVHPALAEVYADRTAAYFGAGIEATSALDAWALGLPGFDALALGDAVDARMSPSGRQLKASRDDYVYHFPDGNAGLARALVRALVPDALPGQGMEALADGTLDAAALDRPGAPVRLRQRALVTGLRHLGPPAQAEWVEVRYVDARGVSHVVRARQVLLACWHRVIARLSDELPPAQRQALDDQVKVPLLYANVLLGRWHAWQRAGVRSLQSVGGFWSEAALDFPVSMGGVHCAQSPDEPIVVHLDKVVLGAPGRPPREQAAAGRAQLLQWRFDELEQNIRGWLHAALGPYGLDAARDIEAVSIHRWAHGYAYEYMRPWDRHWPRGPLPCEHARRGWGRVAIANSDAGAYAYAHSAVDQATRAVHELLPRARLPAWHPMPGPDPRQIGLG